MSGHVPADPRLAALDTEALTEAQLDDRLDYLLNPVLSSRRTAAPLARSLSTLDRAHQDFVLHWVEVVSRTNHEMAYQFAAAAPDTLGKFDLAAAEAWIIEAMDTYDREGLYPGCEVFRNPDRLQHDTAVAASAVTFEDAGHVLELFVCGLSGRAMKLGTDPQPHTDTETLYLPARMARGRDKDENFLILKAASTLLWAQCRYGTFNADLTAACDAYANPARALDVLNALETIRLEARIAVTLPGLARSMSGLRGTAAVDPRCAKLADPAATVDDSIALLAEVYADFAVPALPYGGVLRPGNARAARAARLAREKAGLQSSLARMLAEQGEAPQAGDAGQSGRFSAQIADTVAADGTQSVELALDGMPVALPEDVARLLDSILQDLGGIPDDYLVPAGDGGYGEPQPAQDPVSAWNGIGREDVTYFYNEWDHERRHYRKNWCALRELDINPGDPGFVAATLEKYRPQVAQLRRTFEMMRGEDRWLRREPRGDDIDLDAVVGAYADLRSGMELTDRLFARRQKAERDMAVMFMVDMSGSTKGWINDAEREALVMLCEALEVLGDRYAIYGFSGITRKRCEIFRVKRFDDPYSEPVKARIAGVQPQDYTRMGAAIRHLTAMLDGVEARTKLLITLSDGKPDDYSDNYRGTYGIEDTRRALAEAHRKGVRPFCITIDHEARDYLPHLYGAVNWTLVDDVARLPLKIADIYRRLTT